MSPGIFHKKREETVVEPETKERIDFYWEQPGEDWVYNPYDWLDDSYTVSWQVVPGIWEELIPDPGKPRGAMQSFLKMTKFSVKILLNI